MSGKFTVEAIFKGTDNASKIIASVEGRMGRFSSGLGSGLKEVGKINDKILGGLSSIATQAAVAGAAVGAIAFAGLAHIVKTGADFEQAITNVGAVSGHSRAQIQDLEKAALSLGVTTQFSSTEVANGMEMMARKGFTTQEILAGIPGVLDAVAASGQDMAEVSGVVGSAIRGFGLQASEASHVANVLAFVSSRTGATITDLGGAMSTAAPTARALGVSLEDTAAAVGLLQKMGLDASVAGSATATMLAKLSKPSKDAAAQMGALGIKFQDATGNMLPFQDVLKQFIKVGDKAGGNMKRMAFFADLVGLRGDKAALALADMEKSGDFQKLAEDIKHVGNFAGDVAKIRMDTTLGSWKLFTSTVEVLETKLFGLKSGALREVIDKTNAWLGANQDLIVTDVQGFIKGIADALPKIVMWGERVAKMIGVFGSFVIAVKLATGAMALFTAVSDANPWVLLAYALVVLTAVVVAFWPEIKKHEQGFRQAGVALLELLGAVGLATTAYGVFLLVTNASTIATISYIGYTLAARTAMAAWTFVTNGQAIATAAATAVQWVQTFAVGAYNTVLGIGQSAMALFTGETVTMTGAMTAAAGPILAVVAALASLYLVKKMNDSLKDSTGGMGMLDIAGGMVKDGTLNPFSVVDKHQNEQAKADAIARGQVPTTPTVQGMPALPGMPPGMDPQAMIALLMAQQGSPMSPAGQKQVVGKSPEETGKAMADAMAPMLTEALKKGKGEITITDKTGRAEVSKQPEYGFNLNMTPSGSP